MPESKERVEPIALLGGTKQRILEELLAGPLGALELARRLSVEVNAVRKHLDSLEGMGAVRSEFRRMGAGRPRKLYRLEPAGGELFPRRYDLLFSRTLDTLLRAEGGPYTGRLLARMAREMARDLPVPAGETPREKLEALTGALNDVGFKCSLGTDGGFPCVVNRNCIALRAASRHPGLICQKFHSTLISTALGGAPVELKGCIVRGDPECKHVVHMNRHQKVSKLRKLRSPT